MTKLIIQFIVILRQQTLEDNNVSVGVCIRVVVILVGKADPAFIADALSSYWLDFFFIVEVGLNSEFRKYEYTLCLSMDNVRIALTFVISSHTIIISVECR